MSELSVFIDELDYFYQSYPPLYITYVITFVFHRQSNVVLSEQIKHFKNRLVQQGFLVSSALNSSKVKIVKTIQNLVNKLFDFFKNSLIDILGIGGCISLIMRH